jgi:hypothetical protein
MFLFGEHVHVTHSTNMLLFTQQPHVFVQLHAGTVFGLLTLSSDHAVWVDLCPCVTSQR